MDEAVGYFHKSIDAYPAQPDPVVVLRLALALDKQGKYPDALKEAIDDLPAGQRSAIEMLKLREMSLKEAAAASGTSVGALKVATHRAMDALRRKLKKDVGER